MAAFPIVNYNSGAMSRTKKKPAKTGERSASAWNTTDYGPIGFTEPQKVKIARRLRKKYVTAVANE